MAAPDSSADSAQDVQGAAAGATAGSADEPTSVGLPARWCEGWPVLIQTIPNDLGRVPVPACTADGAGVEAIELLDGDPRGLEQSDRERARERFRFYRDRGYQIITHDLGKRRS